jgi:hypothetical protein
LGLDRGGRRDGGGKAEAGEVDDRSGSTKAR